MAVTAEQLAEIIAEVKQAQSYQAGAWSRVKETGRAWAQLKLHGSYIESNGSVCHVHHSERVEQLAYYQRRLMDEIERAFLEDALAGQTIARALA